MNRRTALRGIGVACTLTMVGALAGCVGDEEQTNDETGTGDGGEGDDNDDSRNDDSPASGGEDSDGESDGDDESPDPGAYEECGREIIPYEDLPSQIQEEVDGELDVAEYRAEYVFLQDAMDVDASFLDVDGEFYDPAIESIDGEERLTLEHVDPQALPNPRSVFVTNKQDQTLGVSVAVETDDGETLLEESVEVADERETVGEVYRVGTHNLVVTVGDGEEIETFEMLVAEETFNHEVFVDPDGIDHFYDIAGLEACDIDPDGVGE